MALQIWIPLHEDATALKGTSIDADALSSALDAVAEGLASAMKIVAARDWPELKRINVDCMLAARDASGDAAGKFVKKTGQFNLECAVGAKPLAKLPEDAQVVAVFAAVSAMIERGLMEKGKPTLSSAAAEFGSRLTPDRVAAFRQSFQADAPDADPCPLPPPAHGTRVRHVMALPKSRGDVWVMLHAGHPHDEALSARIIESLVALVDRESLGRTTGSSTGTSSSDVSFSAKSRAACAQRLVEFLDTSHPDIDYIVSDDYEIIVDPRTGALMHP